MNFKLDDHGFSWFTTAILPSWAGYLKRSGGAAVTTSPDGSVEIVFAPEGRDSSPMTEHEVSLVRWFLDNERSVSVAVKAAIFKEYSNLQDSYGYSPRERAEFMPDISSADDLTNLVGLHGINIHQIENEGVPYIGFELGCTWDDEHGLGVLMHGTRPVKIGGADTAILLWIAEQDAESD